MSSDQHNKKSITQAQRSFEVGQGAEKVGDNRSAWASYVDALNLVPDPDDEQSITVEILKRMGELQFRKPDYAKACNVFKDAVRCRGGLGDVLIHLRLGQCYFEAGDRKRAADELARAYMGGGRDVFANEDPKYFRLVEDVLKPPAGMDYLP
jgi:tetratricopeptide (TPR) repeat protein